MSPDINPIERAEAFVVDIPVEARRTDAIQAFLKQETIFVRIETPGGVGLGYSYTIGTGGSAVLALLQADLLPRLIGQDASRPEAVWHDLFMWSHATSVGPITSLALAAVDLAVWDLRSKLAGLPVWRLLGGAQDRVPLYDTEGGWLHLTPEELRASAQHCIGEGWRGMKIKVGKPTLAEDTARVAAVRAELGDEFALMVDANQGFSAAEARLCGDMLADHGVGWFEEPLPADDVSGHVRLAAATAVPIAVGESLYSPAQFAEYVRRSAAEIIQVDVARIGGITPWAKVAHMAEAFGLTVAPHFLMEIHVSLACAVPNGGFVEHIPQLRSVTTSEMAVADGYARPPQSPGLGIEWDLDALKAMRVG